MTFETKKTVNLNLAGIDGNSFALISAFQKQAKREDWSSDEIKEVIEECKSGDYDHMVQTLIGVCKPIEEDDED